MARQVTSSAANGGYSWSDDMSANEYREAVVLYVTGLDGSTPNVYEIDDVIQAIHKSFYYYPMDENTFVPAHGFFMKKHSSMLKTVYRRAAHARKMIQGAKENV